MSSTIRKNNKLLQKIAISFFVLTLVFVSCAPQHKYAFKQLSTENKGTILSIQGYVISASSTNSLEKDWNILVKEMSKKPGFISSYLSGGVGNSKLVLAHSTWKDLQALRNAFSDKKILELEAKLPKIQFEHLFNLGTLGAHHKNTSK